MTGDAGNHSLRSSTILGLLLSMSASLLMVSCTMQPSKTSSIELNGRIEADETRLGALLPGKVIYVAVKEGARVHQGEELIRLDSSPFEKQLKWTDKLIEAGENEKSRIEGLLVKLRAALKDARVHKKFSDNSKIGVASASLESNFLTHTLVPIEGATEKDVGIYNTSSATDSELQAQLGQIDEIENLQLKNLQDAESATQNIADSAYSNESQMLKDGREEAVKNLGNSFLPRVRKAKRQAIDEVFTAREKALRTAYDAQTKAINESIKSKEEALSSALDAKRNAVKELHSSKQTMMSEMLKQRSEIESDIARQKEALQAKLDEGQNQMQSVMKKLSNAGLKKEMTMIDLQLDQAQSRIAMIDTELTKAKAMRDELQSKITLCSVKSPVDGIVESRCVQPGELVTPGPTLMRIIDDNTLFIRSYAKGNQLDSLKVGQHATVSQNAGCGSVDATVMTIDPEPCFTPKVSQSPEAETHAIKLAFNESNCPLKRGMAVSIKISTSGDVK